ncbi:hypothetical protein P7C71_g5096, partial [Lecanoromycetidae sp. Uapishka_2]
MPGEEYDDSSYVSPPFTSEDIEAPPDAKIRNVNVLKTRYISLSQAQHDPGVQSREDWEREKYADRIAALLYTSPDTPPKKQDPKTVLYGKNKADKILISQLLKDRGQTSYDWRIPLLQLERYYKPSDSKATFEAEGQFRKIESCDPLRRVYLEPLRAPILARDVPEPTSWSEKSVFNYLADVTETQTFQDRIPKVLKPQHRDWSNVKDIADIIFHLFRRSETRRCLTVDACNIALRFFYDHGMFTRARAMYVRMEAMRMDISTETFNIILRSAARHRDLHNFTFLLHHTIQRGLKPDETTWVSLLMAVPSTAVRAIILHKMREKNMLEKPGIATDVAALMVQHDLTFHLGNGHNFDEFLDHMDLRYGVRWLSTSAGNSLLNESSKRRPALETLDLLDGLKLRGFIPDETSMDILLRKCLPLKNRDSVVRQIIEQCRANITNEHEQSTCYPILRCVLDTVPSDYTARWSAGASILAFIPTIVALMSNSINEISSTADESTALAVILSLSSVTSFISRLGDAPTRSSNTFFNHHNQDIVHLETAWSNIHKLMLEKERHGHSRWWRERKTQSFAFCLVLLILSAGIWYEVYEISKFGILVNACPVKINVGVWVDEAWSAVSYRFEITEKYDIALDVTDGDGDCEFRAVYVWHCYIGEYDAGAGFGCYTGNGGFDGECGVWEAGGVLGCFAVEGWE